MKYTLKEMVTPQNYPTKHLQDEIDRAPSSYKDIKSRHPDAILLFRVGDFYETYCEDAQICSDILGITLTHHNLRNYRMAGFPYNALDIYLAKLVRAGYRIAICDTDLP